MWKQQVTKEGAVAALLRNDRGLGESGGSGHSQQRSALGYILQVNPQGYSQNGYEGHGKQRHQSLVRNMYLSYDYIITPFKNHQWLSTAHSIMSKLLILAQPSPAPNLISLFTFTCHMLQPNWTSYIPFPQDSP